MVRGPLAQVVRGVAGTPHLPLAPLPLPQGERKGLRADSELAPSCTVKGKNGRPLSARDAVRRRPCSGQLRNSLFLASLCSLASFFSSSDETLTSALLEDHNTGNRYGSSEEDEICCSSERSGCSSSCAVF